MALAAQPLSLGAVPQLAHAAPLRARRACSARHMSSPHFMAQPARAAGASAGAEEEVSIRRRPPQGSQRLDVGPTFDFKLETVTKEGAYVDNEDFKPRNILEEIVWYKDIEIQRVRAAAARAEREPATPEPQPWNDGRLWSALCVAPRRALPASHRRADAVRTRSRSGATPRR
jgi:hypothetical protein